MAVDWACVRLEVASGLPLCFNPAGGGVRASANSTLNGEGVSRALSGTGNSSDATGEKERSGTRISGRVGGVDEIRECWNITGVGRGTSVSTSYASTGGSVPGSAKGDSVGALSYFGGSSGRGGRARVSNVLPWDPTGVAPRTEDMGVWSFSEISAYCAAWKGVTLERERLTYRGSVASGGTTGL